MDIAHCMIDMEFYLVRQSLKQSIFSDFLLVDDGEVTEITV
jgi:hypothetical protein